MPAIETILLPTDFSAAAAQTARCAAAVARRLGSSVVLLHVAEGKESRSALEEFAAREMPGIEPVLEWCEGDPAAGVVSYTESHHIDLVIMAARGRCMLHTVTAGVLERVRGPVWIGGRPEDALRTVVCALDMLEGRERMLCWACCLAARSRARLIVAHALSSLAYNPGTYYLEADLRRRLIGEARQKIAEMLRSRGAEAEIVVQPGPLAAVVRAAVEDYDASVTVMDRAAAGANDYAAIREARCAVVSF